MEKNNTIPFEKVIEVRWADVDQNGHVRHSAYNDYGAHVRIKLFSEFGFGADKMKALNLGPILFHEECSFIREIKPDDTVRVNVLRGQMKPDGSRWIIHHEIFNQDNVKVAHISVKGAWIDTDKRTLTVPPAELAEIFNRLPEGSHFVYKKNKG